MASRGSPVQAAALVRCDPRLPGDVEGGSGLLVRCHGRKRKVWFGRDVDRPLKAERQPLLHAGDDIVLTLELVGAIVG
jgi:hypothetical protein